MSRAAESDRLAYEAQKLMRRDGLSALSAKDEVLREYLRRAREARP